MLIENNKLNCGNIKRMQHLLRMRTLIKYAERLKPETSPGAVWHSDTYSKRELFSYLKGKGFLADYRIYFTEKMYKFLNKPSRSNQWSFIQARKQERRIRKTFGSCIDKGYLKYTQCVELPSGKEKIDENYFEITPKGEEFTHWSCFIETFLFDYKRTISILAGSGLLLYIYSNRYIIWESWINWLSDLFVK